MAASARKHQWGNNTDQSKGKSSGNIITAGSAATPGEDWRQWQHKSIGGVAVTAARKHGWGNNNTITRKSVEKHNNPTREDKASTL